MQFVSKVGFSLHHDFNCKEKMKKENLKTSATPNNLIRNARESKVTENKTIVSRPRRKPDSSVKGKMNRWEGTDYCEFIPAGTKESIRVMKKQIGPSSFYHSTGQKESSYTVHINVDGKSEDPVAEAFDIFKALTEGERKQSPKLPEGSEGRMLLDNGQGLQVWLDTAKQEVNILARLECSPNIDQQLLQVESQMNVCIGRHRQEILNHSTNH